MKISVITICLNCREHIGQALASVQEQDYPDLEQIVVDGGSTDGTLEIVREFAAKTVGLRWVSGLDTGISNAMNKGLNLATGDIVGFLHADDYYPDKDIVSSVVERFAESSGTVWVTGGLLEVDSNNKVIRALPVRRFSRRRLLRNNIIYHPATFVRRVNLASAGGFDESLRYAMDYDLWLRLSTYSNPVLLNKELACFRVHDGSISSANRLDALKEEYLVRKRRIKGPVGSFFHALYQRYRLFVEKNRDICQ
ncbi:MAG: glycosyltransferase family 2 protein [Desulfuromonadaceae bacterium]|nr:glycosyltransferase family 2 protein [Desulfuromonadaceae bacterium]